MSAILLVETVKKVIDIELYELKKVALSLAKSYVEPLLEQFPPEKYVEHIGPSTVVSSSGSYVKTPMDQVIDSMIKIADWLITENND